MEKLFRLIKCLLKKRGLFIYPVRAFFLSLLKKNNVMGTTYQNLACFEVKINPKSKRAYLDEDLLLGKNIQQVFFMLGSQEYPIRSPFSVNDDEPYLVRHDDIYNYGIFINLFDPDGEQFVKNLSIDHILHNSEENTDYRRQFIELCINRILDTKKSYLTTYLTQDSEPFVLLMYVSYTTRPLSVQSEEIAGSYSIEIEVPAGTEVFDVKLSEYVNHTLRGYPVKQIIASPIDQYNRLLPAYLYLKADNSFIENIPLIRLLDHSTKELYFDSLKIDYEQSYFRFRGSASFQTEKQKLTFIY